jgi:hypothetical protein
MMNGYSGIVQSRAIDETTKSNGRLSSRSAVVVSFGAGSAGGSEGWMSSPLDRLGLGALVGVVPQDRGADERLLAGEVAARADPDRSDALHARRDGGGRVLPHVTQAMRAGDGGAGGAPALLKVVQEVAQLALGRFVVGAAVDREREAVDARREARAAAASRSAGRARICQSCATSRSGVSTTRARCSEVS